ncbi:amidohydrolase [Lunatimonas lonarensis]|uniref:Amidohydrolase n=1 Tax=Lunatimonas lonarensis TaxID=1232681 RepID=R7ZMA8_9BACT|nr:amidohydrolase/deacetylase family metallohydrolase [Lunatimonas lonarensis]EON75233.1 amidohydrolase [Lunatimonas lonarensis]
MRYIPGIWVLLIGCFLLITGSHSVWAQSYDLVIKNGHLFDAKNGINQPMEIAILKGKIAKVASHIPATEGNKVIDAGGMWISPGFIDPHTHVFVGEKPRVFAGGSSSVFPDAFSFRSGVTTVVDAGTSGWRNFEHFKSTVIDVAQTRVLAFLNIAGGGMSGDPYQQDIQDMNPEMTFNMIQKYPDLMVGVKIGHYEGESWQPFDLAVEAAALSNRPLLVECHLPEYSLKEQLRRMRPGDLLTHTYEHIRDREPIIDQNGNLLPAVIEARKRGVLFDLSHGGAGFWFDQAVPAIQQGLTPDTFGTDLHRFSMNSGMKNFANVLSKFLALGLDLEEVLEKATWGTAKALKREDLGHLSEGAVADLTLLSIRSGSFGFVDSAGMSITGNQMIEPELTIRAGRVVYDLNGISATPFKKVK